MIYPTLLFMSNNDKVVVKPESVDATPSSINLDDHLGQIDNKPLVQD